MKTLNNTRKSTRRGKSAGAKTILAAAAVAALGGWAQRGMATTTFTAGNLTLGENFDSMGTTASATSTSNLPGGWVIDSGPATSVYGSAATTVSRAAGTTTGSVGVLTSFSSGGAYNFANRDMTTSTDRSLGFLGSGAFSSPRNIMAQYVNNTGTGITSLTATFDVEKSRSGNRQWNWDFWYGTDGATWTQVPAGSIVYPTDGTNANVFDPPQTTTKMNIAVSGLALANLDSVYLRWTYTGLGGSSSGMALGLDNVSVTATTGVVVGDPNDLVWDAPGSNPPADASGT